MEKRKRAKRMGEKLNEDSDRERLEKRYKIHM